MASNYYTRKIWGETIKEKVILVRKHKLQSVHMPNTYIIGVSVNI